MRQNDSNVPTATTINSLKNLHLVLQMGRHTQVLVDFFKEEDMEEVYQL